MLPSFFFRSPFNTTLVVIIFSLLFCNLATTQNVNSKNDTGAYHRLIIESFIQVYNNDDKKELKRFIKKHFSKAYRGSFNLRVKSQVNYWKRVFKEFGAVELISIGKDTFNQRAIAWVRGKVSKNYFGILYTIRKGKYPIKRWGVLRGTLPSELKKQNNSSLNPEEIQQYLQELSHHDLFSGTVLIANQDSILLHQAYGFSNQAQRKYNQLNTKYLIASTTKMFTAVAIAQLVEKGKLSYDDPIAKYLPNYPKHIASKVTIKHLVTHTSGIELDHIKKYNQVAKKAKSLKALYQTHLKFLPQLKNYSNFLPSQDFNYTNEGFELAGLIIEKVSGQSYFEYIQNNILNQANMKQSGQFLLSQHKTQIAEGYHLKKARRQSNAAFLPYSSSPAGSYYATTLDLYYFLKALNHQQLLSKTMFDRITSPHVNSIDNAFFSTKYGLGFMIDQTKGIIKIGHSGNFYGTSTRCEWYPELNYYVIILSNYDQAANLVGNYLRDRMYFSKP